MHANDYMTYEQFGRRFFEVAVTEQRVAAGFAEIAGAEFEMGPMPQGPGGFARVTAKVKILAPQARRTIGHTIDFFVRIPLRIDLVIDLRLDKQRFTVAGEVGLRATAKAAQPLVLIIDVAKPRPSDIRVDVSSRSIRGELLRIVAGVDGEIRRFIADYVSDEIDKPAAKEAQVIDVAQLIDEAWNGS